MSYFLRRIAGRTTRALCIQPERDPVQRPTEAELRYADFMIGFSSGACAVLFALILILTFWRPTC